MNGRHLPSERLVALFCFAVLLFNPPLLSIFDTPASYAGVPVLYLYLFVAWAALIALLALIIEMSPAGDADRDDAARPTPSRAHSIKTKNRGR